MDIVNPRCRRDSFGDQWTIEYELRYEPWETSSAWQETIVVTLGCATKGPVPPPRTWKGTAFLLPVVGNGATHGTLARSVTGLVAADPIMSAVVTVTPVVPKTKDAPIVVANA